MTYTTEQLTCGPGWNIHGSISATELAEMINDFFDRNWDNPNPTQFTIQIIDGDERTNAICLCCPGTMYQAFAPSIAASVNFIDFDGRVVYSPSKETILKLCNEACL